MSTASDNVKAAGLMTAGMACFTTNDAIIKQLSISLPIGQILFVRGVFMTILLTAVLMWRRERVGFKAFGDSRTLVRAMFEVGVAFTFLNGIARMPLANATTLMFVAPLFLTIIAAFWLRESGRVAALVGRFGGLCRCRADRPAQG